MNESLFEMNQLNEPLFSICISAGALEFLSYFFLNYLNTSHFLTTAQRFSKYTESGSFFTLQSCKMTFQMDPCSNFNSIFFFTSVFFCFCSLCLWRGFQFRLHATPWWSVELLQGVCRDFIILPKNGNWKHFSCNELQVLVPNTNKRFPFSRYLLNIAVTILSNSLVSRMSIPATFITTHPTQIENEPESYPKKHVGRGRGRSAQDAAPSDASHSHAQSQIKGNLRGTN